VTTNFASWEVGSGTSATENGGLILYHALCNIVNKDQALNFEPKKERNWTWKSGVMSFFVCDKLGQNCAAHLLMHTKRAA
jgi:hypothetical protein